YALRSPHYLPARPHEWFAPLYEPSVRGRTETYRGGGRPGSSRDCRCTRRRRSRLHGHRFPAFFSQFKTGDIRYQVTLITHGGTDAGGGVTEELIVIKVIGEPSGTCPVGYRAEAARDPG